MSDLNYFFSQANFRLGGLIISNAANVKNLTNLLGGTSDKINLVELVSAKVRDAQVWDALFP